MIEPQVIAKVSSHLREGLAAMADQAYAMEQMVHGLAQQVALYPDEGVTHVGPDPFVFGLTVFVLALFVGYYVVWRVTPALHSPLMAVTNAISSVIIVGALIAAGPMEVSFSKIAGFVAVILASINIFGGFIVTQRMLHMFKKQK
ncbi:MAG: NAD(P) transhydrogenase subunit alpha [Alphaproteobacteria bacterium]|jgi:H+-translocating NAD(P) transhydrogenase subunit alpha|nr:NAD(P) transhydrogenase subunit alpha [Alphaproteobacteria bacterium]MBT5389209.1 NAD(P) transhydrogenase subunit alpha [Alphaproteobacteria bacterium]MBT5540909.1 NAD(P) transhydrogenase subunit alpha [Alphaproteobacteria bacterium]MBT5654821.1 NAD(P) transhydrogenase subunit alpha [Alphaproteobacteria bacterium]